MPKSYRELEIYQLSFDLFVKTHRISHRLPKYELYELGSQLRRAADSVNSNIVEGYGRSCYKKDFLRFLIYSHASNDETINHLEKLKALYPELQEELSILLKQYQLLGTKINRFITYVTKNWRT
ncbi:four helix bundle protein [Flavilitoribacter nigricans]|uniref:Four helix bundle protein n=1 Tax=Flavilitoribacter nigricans (strain ATCC 23147 / DSM 23189 / NBRC 102662 / NCIMB 1420 / SS-2) TaxID=1122177 RepID=A0A2D0N6U0_FLAN2|nr:four helix bundle protein [Flavilitoribacter nigricans]PHN04100.1 four helix bundle protein [Flavilitoribacter nigricans DSM 23189 = NBRC 102662]